MVREVKVQVDVEGKAIEFVLRRLSYGQRNECLRRATTTNLAQQSASIDPYLYNELRLVHSIVTPAEFKDIAKVKDLDISVAEKLIEEVEKLNEVTNPSRTPSGGV